MDMIWLPTAASLFGEGIRAVMGFLQSAPSPSESACHAKAPWLLPGLTGASSLLRASPTPLPPTHSLLIRCASCFVAETGGKGLPACPTQLSLRAVPFHPGELRRCSQTSLHAG